MKEMVTKLHHAGIITQPLVLAGMMQVDRRDFVLDPSTAYLDSPQDIGQNATISAPHMHAYCLEALMDAQVQHHDHILGK